MSEDTIKHEDAEDKADNPSICYTCIHRRECPDATPTVVMCVSYEKDETAD